MPRQARTAESARPQDQAISPEAQALDPERFKAFTPSELEDFLAFPDLLSGNELAAQKENNKNNPTAQHVIAFESLRDLSNKYGKGDVIDTATELKSRFDTNLEQLGLKDASDPDSSITPILWKMGWYADQAKNPNTPLADQIDVADPLGKTKLSEQIRGDIVERSIGEVYLAKLEADPDFALKIPKDEQVVIDLIMADVKDGTINLKSVAAAEIGHVLQRSLEARPANETVAPTEETTDSTEQATRPERKKFTNQWLKRIGKAAIVEFMVMRKVGVVDYFTDKIDSLGEKISGAGESLRTSVVDRYKNAKEALIGTRDETIKQLKDRAAAARQRREARFFSYNDKANENAQKLDARMKTRYQQKLDAARSATA
jgi:hypothetical protein